MAHLFISNHNLICKSLAWIFKHKGSGQTGASKTRERLAGRADAGNCDIILREMDSQRRVSELVSDWRRRRGGAS